jgi:hypothetical protein
MIEQNSFTLLMTNISTWMISAVFWYGVCYLEFSWTGVIAGIACVLSSLAICLTFTIIPASRPDIRWISNAFSWAYLGYWVTTSFMAGLSSHFQALKAWQIIGMNLIGLLEILQQTLLSISNNIHLYFGCLVVCCYACFYYLSIDDTTTNNPAVNVSHIEDEEEINIFLAQFANIPDDGECPICMGPHNNKTKPFCGHVFCCRCIVTWCHVRSATCPVCRSPVTNLKPDRPLSADELRPIPAVAPALFEIDFDEDLLERECDEIYYSVMAYGQRLCSTVVFCLALVDWLA